MKKIPPVLISCLFACLAAGTAAGEVVANLQNDYVPGTADGDKAAHESLGNGWAYLWNAPVDWNAERTPATQDIATGDITSVKDYKPLVWNSEKQCWAAASAEMPAPTPANYLGLRKRSSEKISGHPGRNRDNSGNPNRYLIMAYTVKESGHYAITESLFENTYESSDGHEVRVYTSAKPEEPVFEAVFVPGTTDSFDTDLGKLEKGATIYVAIGPNASHNSDNIPAMNFSISRSDRKEEIKFIAPKQTNARTAGMTAPNAPGKKAKVSVVGVEDAKIRMFNRRDQTQDYLHLYPDSHERASHKFPPFLEGAFFFELPKGRAQEYRCSEAGEVLAVVPLSENRPAEMEALGFERVQGLRAYELLPKTETAVYRKNLEVGESFRAPEGVVIAGFDVSRPPRTGEMLYNGIRLPAKWPPAIDLNSVEPMPVPWLKERPELVYIDVGRQLFVDDFLIESTDLEREYHYPQKYEGNPILKPATMIEKRGQASLAVAAPKSGGLWWNPDKGLFELWYEAGWCSTVALATSKDGIHWERPVIPFGEGPPQNFPPGHEPHNKLTERIEGTNQVLPTGLRADSWTVVRDYRNVNPAENFKMFIYGSGGRGRARGLVSEDGQEWGKFIDGGVAGDRSTMYYNPFRKKWIFSLRTSSPGGRSRSYLETDDFVKGLAWLPDEAVFWARTDKLDPPDPRIGDSPQLYNLDAVAYESLMLGFYEIHHGPANEVVAEKGHPKNTGLNFAYSRDGFHWYRPDRTIAINSEQRPVWDRGYVQSLGNICVIRGDKLWFYYSGFAGDESIKLGDPGVDHTMNSGMYANGATGVAFLRRDGFVSLNAGNKTCTLTTRPVTFSGKHLFVNIDAPQGSLVAEVADMNGNPIEPFTFANSIPVTGDSTLEQVRWKGGEDLTKLANRPMRFRFRLENGKLYSFWVSRDGSGRSDGYVAGGGPGYTSDIDTVGKAALEVDAKLGKNPGPSSGKL